MVRVLASKPSAHRSFSNAPTGRKWQELQEHGGDGGHGVSTRSSQSSLGFGWSTAFGRRMDREESKKTNAIRLSGRSFSCSPLDPSCALAQATRIHESGKPLSSPL